MPFTTRRAALALALSLAVAAAPAARAQSWTNKLTSLAKNATLLPSYVKTGDWAGAAAELKAPYNKTGLGGTPVVVRAKLGGRRTHRAV